MGADLLVTVERAGVSSGNKGVDSMSGAVITKTKSSKFKGLNVST